MSRILRLISLYIMCHFRGCIGTIAFFLLSLFFFIFSTFIEAAAMLYSHIAFVAVWYGEECCMTYSSNCVNKSESEKNVWTPLRLHR